MTAPSAEERCGYALTDADGEQYPCDRPAIGWRWYQDVGDHEDMLDVACDHHANEGGRRIAELTAERDELRDRLDGQAWADLTARAEKAERERDEYRSCINFGTTCVNCAHMLNHLASIEETDEHDGIERAKSHRIRSLRRVAGRYRDAAEQAEAERDALRAKVADLTSRLAWAGGGGR